MEGEEFLPKGVATFKRAIATSSYPPPSKSCFGVAFSPSNEAGLLRVELPTGDQELHCDRIVSGTARQRQVELVRRLKSLWIYFNTEPWLGRYRHLAVPDLQRALPCRSDEQKGVAGTPGAVEGALWLRVCSAGSAVKRLERVGLCRSLLLSVSFLLGVR